jgi:hypothetical protein
VVNLEQQLLKLNVIKRVGDKYASDRWGQHRLQRGDPKLYKLLMTSYSKLGVTDFNKVLYFSLYGYTVPLCPNCGKENTFYNLSRGYSLCCSQSCSSIFLKSMTPEIQDLGNKAAHFEDAVKRAQITRWENGSMQKTLKSAHSPKARRKAVNTILARNPDHFIEMSRTLGRNAARAGEHFSIKAGTVYYRSSWELYIFTVLDGCNKILTYSYEKTKIPYTNLKGGQSTYYPDLLISYDSGNSTLVEIKPKGRTTKLDLIKFNAAREFSRENNYTFFIVDSLDEVTTGKLIHEDFE